MLEQVQPNIFHIHIDATTFPDDLAKKVYAMGFEVTNFSGHPEGYRHFEPNHHLTWKGNTGQEFQQKWSELETAINQTSWRGYIEGEYVPIDEVIPYKLFNPSTPIPFSIERRRLTNKEQFRETELHVVMDKDNSDKRLISSLLKAGLYGAYIPKKDHTALVLTAQGFKKDIVPLVSRLKEYLITAGGAQRCTLKEERALSFQLVGVTAKELPEIVDKVTYRR